MIVKYDACYEKSWDDFVFNRSVNGTFLQTRNFLNYHPNGRFEDASIMIFKDEKLITVVPGCVKEKEFVFHQGSTYGGIIIGKNSYSARKTIDIVNEIDEYFAKKYQKITLKITPDLFSRRESDLLQYSLHYCGYENYVELSTFVDLKELPDNIIDSFDRNKARNIRKCKERNLLFRQLCSSSDIRDFHKLLTINLKKYNARPIHTVEELINFKESRIPNNVQFYGVFDRENMVAAGMIFVFPESNVVHAQNLSADYRYKEYSPMPYLYYKVIETCRDLGFSKLYWGISTEDNGKILNFGLILNKESYGSKYQLNRVYYKEYV